MKVYLHGITSRPPIPVSTYARTGWTFRKTQMPIAPVQDQSALQLSELYLLLFFLPHVSCAMRRPPDPPLHAGAAIVPKTLRRALLSLFKVSCASRSNPVRTPPARRCTGANRYGPYCMRRSIAEQSIYLRHLHCRPSLLHFIYLFTDYAYCC